MRSGAGVDWSLDGDTLVSVQLFESLLADRASGTTRDGLDAQATVLLQRELWNDTLEARALALQSANDGDGLVQLDVRYELRSNVVLRAGYDVFYGASDGLFGQYGDADRVTIGMEIGF